jgi:hypothetical protein
MHGVHLLASPRISGLVFVFGASSSQNLFCITKRMPQPIQQPENAPAQHFLDDKPQKCIVNLLGALKSEHVIRALLER